MNISATFDSVKQTEEVIEIQTQSNITKARILILIAAGFSFLLSVSLYFLADNEMEGIFVGIWVPSILALGAFIAPRSGGPQ